MNDAKYWENLYNESQEELKKARIVIAKLTNEKEELKEEAQILYKAIARNVNELMKGGKNK